MKIENYHTLEKSGDVYYITLPFDKDFPLLKVNFDVTSEDIEVEGIAFTVVDCLTSDNGEWIVLVCNRIWEN